jgi:hypothetical protein
MYPAGKSVDDLHLTGSRIPSSCGFLRIRSILE